MEEYVSYAPPTKEDFRVLAKVAVPFGIMKLLKSLSGMMPRIVLGTSCGAAALGYFTPSAYFMFVAETFVYSIQQAACPRLAKLLQCNPQEFLRLMFKLVLLGSAIGAGWLQLQPSWEEHSSYCSSASPMDNTALLCALRRWEVRLCLFEASLGQA